MNAPFDFHLVWISTQFECFRSLRSETKPELTLLERRETCSPCPHLRAPPPRREAVHRLRSSLKLDLKMFGVGWWSRAQVKLSWDSSVDEFSCSVLNSQCYALLLHRNSTVTKTDLLLIAIIQHQFKNIVYFFPKWKFMELLKLIYFQCRLTFPNLLHISHIFKPWKPNVPVLIEITLF